MSHFPIQKQREQFFLYVISRDSSLKLTSISTNNQTLKKPWNPNKPLINPDEPYPSQVHISKYKKQQKTTKKYSN